MAKLLLQMQTIGLAAMLTRFGLLLRGESGARSGHVVVLGASHSWDETRQLLRELPGTNEARQGPARRTYSLSIPLASKGFGSGSGATAHDSKSVSCCFW